MRLKLISTHLSIFKGSEKRHFMRKEGAESEKLSMLRKTIICFISPASNQSFAFLSSTSCITSSAVLQVTKG